MTAPLRLFRPAHALVALGLAGRATAQSGSAASPFMPPAAAMAAASPSETLEFAGINVMGAKTFVSVYDKQAKKGRWISVGGSDAGISVLAYDPRREQIVVKSGDSQKTLTLRKSTGALNAPTPADVLPPAAGFAAPPIAPIIQKIQPPPPESTDLTGPANPPATPPAGPVFDPNAKPTGEAKPLTVARQEEEARMLVSDLLEIGMAQRKAYEEAQKKAASGPPDQPAPPPTPPPGG